MLYNGCMKTIENNFMNMYHEDGIIPTPHGYTTTFCTLVPGQNNVSFQIFYKEEKEGPTRKRFRVSILRDMYEHSSYCEVEMFMLGMGWSRLLRTPIIYPELKNLSPVALENPTQGKYNEVFTIMSNASCTILNSALHIL